MLDRTPETRFTDPAALADRIPHAGRHRRHRRGRTPYHRQHRPTRSSRLHPEDPPARRVRQAVADTSLDPHEQVPLADIEPWYWPGTDAGAHPNAVADWRAHGTIREECGNATVPLDQVVWAMIR
ncbi:MAG: hypothetical protein ACRDYA_19645 [Egibacteraceae bacterium]